MANIFGRQLPTYRLYVDAEPASDAQFETDADAISTVSELFENERTIKSALLTKLIDGEEMTIKEFKR